MEKKNRKTYPREFKIEALELAKQLGNLAAASRQLGISDSLLYSWKEQLKFDEKGTRSAMEAAAESDEVKRLRKENEELKKVNYILKKAAAFFSQDHLK